MLQDYFNLYLSFSQLINFEPFEITSLAQTHSDLGRGGSYIEILKTCLNKIPRRIQLQRKQKQMRIVSALFAFLTFCATGLALVGT